MLLVKIYSRNAVSSWSNGKTNALIAICIDIGWQRVCVWIEHCIECQFGQMHFTAFSIS